MTTTDKASEELSRLLRGMARRASKMRWNYIDACDQGDMLIRQRDKAQAEAERLKAKLEKAYTLIGERALRDIEIEPPVPERKTPRVFRVGDTAPERLDVRLRDSRPGCGFTWETTLVPSGMWVNELFQWVHWDRLVRDYGPLTEIPASPKAGA